MPLAFLGAIGGFLKGLVMGLAVVVAGVLALAFVTDGDKPGRAPVAVAPPAPKAAAPTVAQAPAAPETAPPALASMEAGAAPALPQAGGDAPVNRLNADALAALARADADGAAFSDPQASAPRPTSSGGAALAPAGTPDAAAPAPIFDDESGAPRRAAPARLAALDDGAGRGGFGASGGQALAAVSGVTLPRPFDGGAAAEAGFAPPTPGAPLMAPAASGMAPPAGPQSMTAPGQRMAALSPPGGGAMQAPAFGDAGLSGAAPRLAAPGLPSPSRAPGGLAGGSMAGPAPGAGPTPGLRGGAPLIAPGQRAPDAASPAAPQRIASLTPGGAPIAPATGVARGLALPGLGDARPPTADGDAPASAAADSAASRPNAAPAAPIAAAPEADMAALRDLIASQTGGVPLPFARPPRAAAPAGTPVERLDLAATGAGTPVQRIAAGAAQPGLAPRDGAVAATPVTRLDAPSGAAPNAAAAAVLGPGRLDDRRASSLVAAISTRPGSGVSAPRIVAAPGLSQDPGGRDGAGYGGAQSSAPRPTFGAAAPTLGAAGAPPTEDAPLVVASRGGGVVASRGSDAPLLARPRVGALPSVGAPARAQPFASPAADEAPVAATGGPMLALVLHGLDPMLAADPAGPLAPLLAANAPITLVAPIAHLTDPEIGARLRAIGVDLVVEADPRADLGAIAALGAVAVLPVSGDGRPISMSAVRRFLTGMRNKGLALFNPAPGGGPTARMAMNMGLQAVDSMQRVEIRSEANMAALRSSLDRAAFDARKHGGAAIEIWATDAAIAEAAAWFAAASTATASPATVSALLQQRR